MKAKAWLWLVGMVAVVAAAPVRADPSDQRLHRFFEERQQQRQQQREFRREQREELQERGRLSPEERRQLRQDIRSANQDLYRRGPSPPPPPSSPRRF